jgi:DNA modification methylase
VTGPQGGDLLLLLLQSLFESGLLLKHMLIWVKNNHVLGRCDYNYKHEPIIYGWKDGGHKFYGGGGAVSVWEIDKPHRSDLHPTMKPVELVVRAIENSTTKKETVLDMFLGSGTTLVACEQTGRTCYGNELDPHYCDVIVQRYVNFTGNRELKRNGEPYIWQADQKEQQK